MTRTKLETKEMLNYRMIFKGEVRTLPKVILTKSPFDGKWCISAAEFGRLRRNYFVNVKRWFDGKEWVNSDD